MDHVWIGLAKGLKTSEKGDASGLGLFVTAIGSAKSRASFRRGVSCALAHLGWQLTRLEDVELFAARARRMKLNSRLARLASAAHNGEVRFMTFHTFSLVKNSRDR